MKTFDHFAELIEAQLQSSPTNYRGRLVENLFQPIAKLIDIKQDELEERVANLGMDDISDLIDAVNMHDEAKVLMILNYGKNVGETEENEDDELPVDFVEKSSDEIDSDRAPDSQHGLLSPDETLEETISTGQEVRVGKQNGVVKIADGPGDTAGVLIDGEMQMVDKKSIKRVDETVLGMTALPGLKRMQELAGIANPIFSAEMQPAPAIEKATEVLDLPNSEEAAVSTGTAAEIEKVEDAVEADVASDEAIEQADVAKEECADDEDCDDEEGAERPHEVNPPSDPEAEISAALEVIERNIRNLKVGAFKAINDRMQAIQGSLFEQSVIGRKPL